MFGTRVRCKHGGSRRSQSGSTSSSSFMRVIYHGARVKCHCHMNVVIRISSTGRNPGRLFFGCPLYGIEEYQIGTTHCEFFEWVNNVNVDVVEDEATSDDAGVGGLDVGGFEEMIQRIDEMDCQIKQVAYSIRILVAMFALLVVMVAEKMMA